MTAPDPILADPAEVSRALGRGPEDGAFDYIVASGMDALAGLSDRLAPGGVIGCAVLGRIAHIRRAQARALAALLRDPSTSGDEPPAPEATLAEVAQAAGRSGLVVAGVAPRADYEIASRLSDPVLRARVEALPDLARWSFAELWTGQIATHRVFLKRGSVPEAAPRTSEGIAALAAQYESFPYPERDPALEAKRLLVGSPSNLPEVDHWVFGGRRSARRSFRALVAGGGTGDGSIMLAQQLADIDAQARVFHLDLSEASLAVARARAEARGLKNLSFVKGSLLDLDALGLGRFDYIDCCGVLHHLEDPAAGLKALARALLPDGGIGLMLYGAVGRACVYPVQDMLRLIAPAESTPAAARIDLARRLVRSLPPSNAFAGNADFADHIHGGDAGVFDLLLHSRDRAFRASEVFDLAASAGFRIAAFVPPAAYRPAAYLKNEVQRARARSLDPVRAAEAAELLSGRLAKHVAYLVRADNAVAPPRLDEPDAIPMWRGAQEGRLLASARGRFTARLDGLRVEIGLPPPAQAVIARIDGIRPVAALFAPLTDDDDDAHARRTLATLVDLGILFLRRAGSN